VTPGRERAQAEALTVPSVPASVAAVRRYTTRVCRTAGLDALADTAALLVSEVATNALVHGRGDVRVRASADARVLRVEVSDEHPRLPQPRLASVLDEGGRGLALLEALSTRWGTEGRPDGKTVWFELVV
jgi:anti-sigma regulatory factor (Ser/Thr protein kinase)